MENLWHVVLVSFRPTVSESVKREIHHRFQTLAQDCGGKEAGILFWKVGYNLDNRKNVHLVEISIFKNHDALQKFKKHPKHKEFTNLLRQVADWQVGDIQHPLSLK